MKGAHWGRGAHRGWWFFGRRDIYRERLFREGGLLFLGILFSEGHSHRKATSTKDYFLVDPSILEDRHTKNLSTEEPSSQKISRTLFSDETLPRKALKPSTNDRLLPKEFPRSMNEPFSRRAPLITE